ncbi:MAG: hypothetical protein FWE89_02000 [Syntrophaceae bacterium]|nr:hypothetical protein [Syntrophaceae bacterium]
MVFTRKGFSQVVGNALAGFGFAPEAPSIYEFPLELFLPGSDLTPIRENIDKVVYGLTKWEPKVKQKGVVEPGANIPVRGATYEEAVQNMNYLFLTNLWADGLPLLPATESRVNWILTGTDLSPSSVIGEGKVLTRGGIATVKQVAISLAMAGGRPEYLPVLIAAVEAMLKPPLRHQHWQPTTASTHPIVIVNGPAAKELRLNSGYGCLGPDPVHPAGASIGRALRLIQMNLGGALPGIGTMAIHGANRYTNIVFAEDEDGLPQGWKPLSVERGFAPGKNVVTVHAVEGTVNINGASTTTPEVISTALNRLAGFIGVPSDRYWSYGRQPDYPVGIALFARASAKGLADHGWSKEKVKAFLWENTKIPWSMVQKMGTAQEVETWLKNGAGAYVKGQPWPITLDPKNIMIVVAGGEQSGHMYWIQGGNGPVAATNAEIQLPARWKDLLKAAEGDLGPPPAF